MSTDNLREELDEVLELLHNSWLEDDYNSFDPDAIEAKQALMKLISAHSLQERNRLLDDLADFESEWRTGGLLPRAALQDWIYTRRKDERRL